MIHDAVERVRLMREAVGDDMEFCLELHRRMKPGDTWQGRLYQNQKGDLQWQKH